MAAPLLLASRDTRRLCYRTRRLRRWCRERGRGDACRGHTFPPPGCFRAEGSAPGPRLQQDWKGAAEPGQGPSVQPGPRPAGGGREEASRCSRRRKAGPESTGAAAGAPAAGTRGPGAGAQAEAGSELGPAREVCWALKVLEDRSRGRRGLPSRLGGGGALGAPRAVAAGGHGLAGSFLTRSLP